MNRIYHHYEKWECYKHGFFASVNNSEKQYLQSKIIELFNSEKLTKFYMNEVIEKWKVSCEQNLSNSSMNRIAWLGQSACCLYCGASCYLTMNSWNLLDNETQNKADKIALKIINKWEQEKKYKLILNHGNQKDTKQAFQMKLQLN